MPQQHNFIGFAYSDQLGLETGQKPPPEVLASHIAPKDNPDAYYKFDVERETADWLRKSFGLDIRSVRERKSKGRKNPDAYVFTQAGGLTVEMKHPESNNYLTIRNHLVKAFAQGEYVVIIPDNPLSYQDSVSVLSDALSLAGLHAEGVILKTKGGRYVVYQRR